MHGGARNMRGEKKMIYKNISFKATPFSYELVFDDRITLVGGDSGTGLHFWQLVNEIFFDGNREERKRR